MGVNDHTWWSCKMVIMVAQICFIFEVHLDFSFISKACKSPFFCNLKTCLVILLNLKFCRNGFALRPSKHSHQLGIKTKDRYSILEFETLSIENV